jgi:CTP:molybdopterin cytidylyltransferase MocA
MGQPKALLPWDGKPLILAHIAALSAVCSKVIVVLGAHAEAIARVLPEGVHLRTNHEWAHTDMAASLRIGLEGIAGDCVVTPVDVPPPPHAVLRELLGKSSPCVCCHRGTDGHPVLVNAPETWAALEGQPLNQLLSNAPRLEVHWPGCTQSWNTPAEWALQSPSGTRS